MKYIYTFLMLAFTVIATSTVAPKSAEAVTMVEYCGEWPETPTGLTVINVNNTPQGTHITVQRTCYTVDPNCGVQGGIGCVNYVTQTRVYHYQPAQ